MIPNIFCIKVCTIDLEGFFLQKEAKARIKSNNLQAATSPT